MFTMNRFCVAALLPVFILLLLVSPFGCKPAGTVRETPVLSKAQQDSLALEAKTDRLLALFKPVDSDSFFIFPHAFEESDSTYKFCGRPVDTSLTSMMSQGPAERDFDWGSVFAGYKYQLNDHQYILIFRSNGEFFSSPVGMITWDRRTKKHVGSLVHVGSDEQTSGYEDYITTTLCTGKSVKSPELFLRNIEKGPTGDVYDESIHVDYLRDTAYEHYILKDMQFELLERRVTKQDTIR